MKKISNTIETFILFSLESLESVLCRYITETIKGSHVGILVESPIAIFIRRSITDSVYNKTKEHGIQKFGR